MVSTLLMQYYSLDRMENFIQSKLINNQAIPSSSASPKNQMTLETESRYLFLAKMLSLIAIAVVLAAYVFLLFLERGAVRRIEELLEKQRRFIADASHELKTPLSIMKATAEVALMGTEKECQNPACGEIKQTVKSSLEEIDRMSRIIRRLISISYIENQAHNHGIIKSYSKINLEGILSAMLSRSEKIAAEKKIKIIRSKIDHATIWGNQTGLEEVVLNLINNAINYTPEGGLIFVSLEDKSPKLIELKVKDTGIGIADKDLPLVFNPFYRTEAARNFLRKRGSSGLGLTIVKEILKKHGADIEIKSAIGRGTTVWVRFPTRLG